MVKFNVKVPGSGGEKGDQANVDSPVGEPIDETVGEEAKSEGVGEEDPKPLSFGKRGRATQAGDDDGEPEASRPVGGRRLRLPGQPSGVPAAAGEVESAPVGADEAAREPVVANVMDESSTVANPFLEDDDSELTAEVRALKPATSDPDAAERLRHDSFLGGERAGEREERQAVGGAQDNVDKAFNPLLDELDELEDGDIGAPTEGLRPLASYDPTVVESAEVNAGAGFNPLLEDDEDEEFQPFMGRAKGAKPSSEPIEPTVANAPRVTREVDFEVPKRPMKSLADRVNADKKRKIEEAKRSARTGDEGAEAPAEEAPVDFKKKKVQEVEVDERGRPKAGAPKGKRSKGAKASAKSSPVEVESVVKTTAGDERWRVKSIPGGGQAKVGKEQLALFRNLNLDATNDDSKEKLQSIFAKIDEAKLEDEEKAKRRELMQRAVLGDESVTRGSRKMFTEKDRDVLRFLAKFKYANAKHVSRILQVTEKTMEKRLHSLRKRGLLVQKDLYGAKPLWYLTEAGMICSGLDLPRTKDSSITYGMLPHGFVVNHVAGNLWGGGVNVLNLEEFPVRNRTRESGEKALGEDLVSELEIQSSFSQIRIGSSKEAYRPLISDSRERLFKEWTRAGGIEFGPSPEQLPGNEFMWTLIPPFQLNLAYHVPDLVVKRPRNADGTPNSIAVEVELANKPYPLYERALYAYKYDSLLYGQVIWVVKSRGAARKLEQAADSLGLLDEGRMDIVPIYTEEGVFTGKAEWTI